MIETTPHVEPPPSPPRSKWRPFVIAAVVLAMGAGLVFGVQALGRVLGGALSGPSVTAPDVPPGQVVEVEVPPGATARTIGRMLTEVGVIESPLEFEVAVRAAGVAEQLQAGRYELLTGSDVAVVIDVLLAGPVVETYRVLVREGLWITEILDELALQTPWDREDFEAPLLGGDVTTALAPGPPASLTDWEGLLHPDTYDFAEEATPVDILQRLASTMERRVAAVDWSRLDELDVTRYEAIIVASLIEAEVRLDEERPLVASVIYNRLAIPMGLGIDAAVVYAHGDRAVSLTTSALDIDSPYNLRKFAGLPPTPIGAPGLASLQAAADPAETDFLYYVLIDFDGHHGFSETLAEHNRKKAEARAAGVIP